MLGWENRPREVKKLVPRYTASRSDFNAHILIISPQCLSLRLCIALISTLLLKPLFLFCKTTFAGYSSGDHPLTMEFFFGSNFAIYTCVLSRSLSFQ